MIKITHDDLIDMCRDSGIFLEKITRNYAYLKDADDEPREIEIKAGQKLPNRCPFGNLGDKNIYTGWKDPEGLNSLFKAIQEGRKVKVVQIIRKHTELGLKDSKDIMDSNWEEWSRICRKRD